MSLIAAAVAATIGCGSRGGLGGLADAEADSAPDVDGSVPGVTITLGTAATDGSGFLPMTGDITLVPGGQGGFHVWMKFRASGAPAVMVNLAYSIRRASDDHLVLTAMRQQMLDAPGPAGYWELPTAIPSFMCPSPLGVQVHDEPMHYRLDITTLDGAAVGTGAADFTPLCPTDGQATHCASICSG